MDLERQKRYRDSLKEVYGDFFNSQDSTDALIALVAKERDEYETKIEIMENHYREVIQEYKDVIKMWRDQAQSTLELLKLQQAESYSKHETKQIIEG